MKLLTMISTGLVLAAASAQAQSPSPSAGARYTATSDLNGPYADVPPAPVPGYGGQAYGGPAYGGQGYGNRAYGSRDYGDGDGPNGYGPSLLPPGQVYIVLRDNGFSPLGNPRQRGFFYTIAAIDRRGDDGRVVIDARNGRIVRFMPAYHFGEGGYGGGYGDGPDAYGPPARISPMRYGPAEDEIRPPAPVPRVASRTPSAAVPLPKPDPARSVEMKPRVTAEVKPLPEKPAAEKPPVPAQGQQSAANQIKPAEMAPPPASPAPAPVAAKPSAPQQPEILPTQEMPKVQGFE
jgi:hypothetical protein